MTDVQTPQPITDRNVCGACALGRHADCFKLITHAARGGRRGHHTCRCATCRPIVATS